MRNKLIVFISILLSLLTLIGAFSSCTVNQSENGGNDTVASETTSKEEISSKEETSSRNEETGIEHESVLTGEYASLVENAYWLSNGVKAYYTTASRNAYTVENQAMKLNYSFDPQKPQLVTSLTTPGGNVYLSDTMDVYVKMADGNTYYASNSTIAGTANIYRLGYYYYDVHLADQGFADKFEVLNYKKLSLSEFKNTPDMSEPVISGGVLTTTVTDSFDPYIYGNVELNANDFNALQVSLRTTHITELQLYVDMNEEGFSDSRWIKMPVVNDGKWHTYTFMLNDLTLNNYSGKITGLRFDFWGCSTGAQAELKEITALNVDTGDAPALYLDRTLHVYSDKMNHVVRICAMQDTHNIAEIGQITELSANTVDKIVVKDAKGEHSAIDEVDWATAEYVAFDVKDVGIFGYILLPDKSSGSMMVSLEDGKYRIVQYTTPQNGTILAPVDSTEHDFYMGQRIYTDLNHDFDAFRNVAYEERNPLSSDNIVVDTDKSPDARYLGYDAIRGAYKFNMEPNSDFNVPYYEEWNKHYNLVFDITGDDRDRNIYIMTYAHGTCLENGVLLGKGDMLLPVSLEVCKNFGHENEEPLFDRGDDPYSETYFPMVVTAGKTAHYTVLNLYQNWGNFPLKQVSSIQCFAPYYHLSTGVTESNCITPYYVYSKDMSMLPDHRAMSAPLWSEMENPANGRQPQHTYGGYHYFLQYVDASGKHIMSESTYHSVNSYGPTYADIDMGFISDDGKIRITYNHMEMPQTDENRTYYQLSYEILEDITFENFKRDFSFYSVRGFSNYRWVGYLDKNNQPAVVRSVKGKKAAYYTLGNNAPYFDMFQMVDNFSDDYVNVSFLIADSSFIIGGEKQNVAFAIKNESYATYLTLDLEQVTFKKGDTITISAIIMPWGSHLSDYSSDAPDKNVRDVRSNTLLDPIKLNVACGEDISGIFLPKIKAENNYAEFTIRGGENNTTLRVYGFDKLSVPKIYEKINGEWVEYKINSLNNPDTKGYHHYYDGYMIHYDGDGTFSYSFVVSMDDSPRTFKVELDSSFNGWPEDPEPVVVVPPAPETPLTMYFTPRDIDGKRNTAGGFGEIKLADDASYIRFYGNNAAGEAYFTLFTDGSDVTGKYVAIRYRTSKSDSQKFNHLEFFSGTDSKAPTGQGDYAHTPGVIEDGEWHVIVFDLAAFLPNAFKPDANGNYSAKYLRCDLFNQIMPADTYIDIAWIGMDSSLDEIIAECQDLDSIQLATWYDQIKLVPTK